jgi:hypothetical protein
MKNDELKFVFEAITNLLKPEYSPYSKDYFWNGRKRIEFPLALINLEKPVKLEFAIKYSSQLLIVDMKENSINIKHENLNYSFDPRYIFLLKNRIDKLPKDKKNANTKK